MVPWIRASPPVRGVVPESFKCGLTEEQVTLLQLLLERHSLATAEIEELLGRNRRAIQRDLRALAEAGRAVSWGQTNKLRWAPVLDP